MAYTTKLLPSTGLSARSARRRDLRRLDDVPLEEPSVAADGPWLSLRGPTAHFSHQYGECSACAWWLPVTVSPALRSLAFSSVARVDPDVAAGAFGAWYSSQSIQLTFSGNQLGTVAANDAAGAEHTRELGDRADVVLDVLEHLAGDDAVERAVGERQPGGVAPQHADEAVGGDLARLDHRRRTSLASPTTSSWA